MTDIGTKLISDFEIKDADRGEVTAVVSVFNVVDRDGDVILPGAIKDGTVVKISAYGHDVVTEGKPPVGRGVLRVDDQRAVLHAKYFMSTERGRDAFATVKELGADNEWSIGWPNSTLKTAKMTDEWRGMGAKRLVKSLDVLESSPVFLGSNQFTRTVGTKEAGEQEEESPEEVARRVAEAQERAAAADAQRKQEIVAAVEKTLADMKAAEEAEAERKRQEEAAAQERAAIATKAAEEKAAAEERAKFNARATKEFERFHRNMRLYGV